MSFQKLPPAQWSTVTWVTVILSVLIISATITIVTAINGATSATREADYRACLAAQGYDDTDVDSIVSAADICYRAVYGDD